MISYFRTTKKGVEMAIQALEGIPTMVLKSVRSKFIFHAFTKEERIIYDLEPDEWFNQTKITDTTHVLIIPSNYLQDAQIKELLTGIVMPWVHVEQRSLSKSNWYYTDQYAYETNSGNIFFKIPGLKKQLKFDKSVL
jgi:hypothetical protein